MGNSCSSNERERNIATVRVTNPVRRLLTSSRGRAPLLRAGSVREAEAMMIELRATRTRDFENRCDTSHTILREPTAGFNGINTTTTTTTTTSTKPPPPSSLSHSSFASTLPKSLHHLLKKGA